MVPRYEGLEESIKEPVISTGCRQDASMPKIGAVEVVHFPNVLKFLMINNALYMTCSTPMRSHLAL